MIAILLFLCSALFTTEAWTPAGTSRSLTMKFDLEKSADILARNKILTKTANLGLLSRLDRAGFTLTTAAPLLKAADKYDALGYLEASSDNILPLVAKVFIPHAFRLFFLSFSCRSRTFLILILYFNSMKIGHRVSSSLASSGWSCFEDPTQCFVWHCCCLPCWDGCADQWNS